MQFCLLFYTAQILQRLMYTTRDIYKFQVKKMFEIFKKTFRVLKLVSPEVVKQQQFL